MSGLAVIALSNAGARLAVRLAQAMDPCMGIPKLVGRGIPAEPSVANHGSPGGFALPIGLRLAVRGQTCSALNACDVFLHKDVARRFAGKRFGSVRALTRRIFRRYRRLVYIMPCGVVVRAIAGVLQDKTSDPAIVAVDIGARYAVSLLSGHEGGANALALGVANALAAEPVISTSTEAARDVIVGVGCRRGAPEADIIAAVRGGLRRAGVFPSRVRVLASADIKKNEEGLITAAVKLGFPLRFISAGEIRSTRKDFGHSPLVKRKINLPAVAEPSALLAGRRTKLILRKTVIRGVTVAVARENSL